MPPCAMFEVKIGFSLLCSACAFPVAVQLEFRNDGMLYVNVPRWSRRAAKTETDKVSARPRMLMRVYSNDPRGPQNVFSLVLKPDGSPTGGIPGTATVPLGRLPPRLITSNPNP